MISHLIQKIKDDIHNFPRIELDYNENLIMINDLDLVLYQNGSLRLFNIVAEEGHMIDFKNLYVYIGWNGWDQDIIRLNDIIISIKDLKIIELLRLD